MIDLLTLLRIYGTERSLCTVPQFKHCFDWCWMLNASWIACLIVLVLTTTFKCSLKAFLKSTTLSSPAIVMAHMHASRWAQVMLLRRHPLEGSTWGTHSLRILEHVDWEVPKNFDISRVLCPCGNKSIALNLFSSSDALMGKEYLHNHKRKCPKRPHY